MIDKDKLIMKVNSIDDIVRCNTLSSLLEISGWPKPGNVHRTKDFLNTKYEHFLAGTAAISPVFLRFCERIQSLYNEGIQDFGSIELGLVYKEAVERMTEWQKGGNVMLGHILILSPLTAAAVICFVRNQKNYADFKINLIKIIEEATVADTLNLYEAIRLANPGGLGVKPKYDLNNDNALEEIKKDNIRLKEIFEYSQNYDLISKEYVTDFHIILEENLPYFLNQYRFTKDINNSIVNTFLNILSTHHDTLIIRKSGLEAAESVSKRAKEILALEGFNSKKGKKAVFEMDEELQKKKGKMNPGTTADLTAGVIFCGLLFGVRF